MRLLMLDNEFPPLGGGMGTANQALLHRFAHRTDLEIDLVTSALGGRSEEEQFSDRIRVFKVPVWNRNIHHSTNRELLTYAVEALPLAMRLHGERPYDLCFAWSTVPAGGVACALQRLKALPYMVWVSGPDIPGFERRYRLIYPLLSPVLRSIWRQAAIVVVKCQGELDMVHSLDGRLDVTLIPNGVDLTLFQPGPPIPDDGPLHVLCVGRLIERKGQPHLLEAAKRLIDEGVDLTLHLVGTGDARGTYEALARKLGISDQVRFVGFVPRTEIASCFASAHVFASPSFCEGMSIAVLEAMAAALPVVVTRTGGTDELVEEGTNGLTFEWGDVNALAGHLRLLATDRALARRMGAAGRARAVHFSWDAVSRRYLGLFAELGKLSRDAGQVKALKGVTSESEIAHQVDSVGKPGLRDGKL
jgi:phosphatidylinositol alpha-1,6-mannosyltransferase